MRVVVAPYSTKLSNGKPNPKNYPWWDELLTMLDCEVIQIGIAGEDRLVCASQFIQNWPLSKLRDVIREADGWLSVDSFLPHFCFIERLRSGVVIWSQSDYLIWGHPENLNLLKSRDYLREHQYAPWSDATYNKDAFIRPEEAIEPIRAYLTRS